MTTSTLESNYTNELNQIFSTVPWPVGKVAFFSSLNIFLSITASLGNALILVALHKESSLHPPTKLLFQCLAVTNLCVGLITQPLCAVSMYHSIPFYVGSVNSSSSYILIVFSIGDFVVKVEEQTRCNIKASKCSYNLLLFNYCSVFGWHTWWKLHAVWVLIGSILFSRVFIGREQTVQNNL